MALETFNPVRNPNIGAPFEEEPKVLVASFGDGYSQRARDGINNIPVKGTWEWTALTESEKDYILDFVRARGGYEAFYYTLPDESEQKTFRCPKWTRTPKTGHWDVRLEFEQVFDI